MLSERASRLKATIDAVQVRAASLGRVQALVTATEKLTSVHQELSLLGEWERALASRDVSVVNPGNSKRLACDAVKAYREKLSTNAAAEPAVIVQLANQVRAAANEWRTSLNSAWIGYVQSQAPVLNTAVLAVLRGIPSLRSSATQLERCLRVIDNWRSGLPTDASAANAFDVAVAEAKRTWRQLGGEDLGAEVAQFLQAAATSEATIESLTPEIEEWLKKHKIWSAFRISLISDEPAPRDWR